MPGDVNVRLGFIGETDLTGSPTFGDLLRQYRLAAGITQEELAARAQVSPRAISDLERGQRSRPWHHTVQLLAAALELEPPDRARLEAAARQASPASAGTLGSPARQDVSTPQHNLPVQVTSFVGRERDVADVKRLLASTHLLTLTGTGGCGKTRLALQVAGDLVETYPDGVWLVEFAALTDESLVPQVVLSALGLRTVPGQPVRATLTDYLRARSTLLVLDNCEHLIGPCAHLVDALLRACPRLRILATSRELLGVAGEVAWSVPSLAVPDPSHLPPLEVLGDVDAVRLFADRATTGHPGFAVTPQNAGVIAQICWRLDGIPLAIEMAAARIRGLTVEQIAARLDDRFRLLTGGSRTALRRHQTLRAAIDWSHDLLAEDERIVFRRLAVFAGGWTLEAAESVGGGGHIDDREVTDLLLQLVDKSLVLVDERKEAARYHYLETTRQYASEKLLDAGEAAAVRNRHRDWYLTLAERAEPELRGGEQGLWLDRLEAEHDNLRGAVAWSHGQPGDARLELRLTAALGRFWHWRGYQTEGLERLRLALERTTGEVSGARALALNWAGRLEAVHGNADRARELLSESVALSRQLPDPWLIAFALRQLATIGGASVDERHQLLAESLRYGRNARAKHDIAWALLTDARFLLEQGAYKTAERLLREGLALAREVRDRTSGSQCLNALGWLARLEGDDTRAHDLFAEALAMAGEIDYMHGIVDALLYLGALARARKDLPAARPYIRRSLVEARRAGDVGRVILSLELDAMLRVDEGAWDQAVRLLSAVEALQHGRVYPWLAPSVNRSERQTSVDAARRHLSDEAFVTAWTEGQAITREQAIVYALEEDRV